MSMITLSDTANGFFTLTGGNLAKFLEACEYERIPGQNVIKSNCLNAQGERVEMRAIVTGSSVELQFFDVDSHLQTKCTLTTDKTATELVSFCEDSVGNQIENFISTEDFLGALKPVTESEALNQIQASLDAAGAVILL